MTSVERGLALYRAVRYVVDREVPGAFVECGVWKGGSSMITMLTLLSLDIVDRQIYLFDTFAGMTPPGTNDVDFQKHSAEELMIDADKDSSLIWARCTLDEVKANVATTEYPTDLVHFVSGDVQQTAEITRTGIVALLRLDTDFYDSTFAELSQLYPRLIQHGILIIDDYGHWQGCRKAVDDYFRSEKQGGAKKPARPFLHAIDYTGRIAVRSEANPPNTIERYDWEPALGRQISLLKYFPDLAATDVRAVNWPYLRKEVPHIWRTDLRSAKPNIGVLSVEESVLLHNLAIPFRGKRALEIGCHFGWSTAHLLAADLSLDVVDPALGDADQRRAVESSLSAIPTTGAARLWPAFSPGAITAIRLAREEPWSFVFIDGNHEGEGPKEDAKAVEPLCANCAAVVFHDLAAPAVAAGLAYLQSRGWFVRIYNTMQIMAVAWRGDYTPVEHTPDPLTSDWNLAHLQRFRSGCGDPNSTHGVVG